MRYVGVGRIDRMPYFFDTYAIIKYLQGDKKFHKYFKKGGILTRLNLMELYFRMLREYGEKEAERIYAAFSIYLADYDENSMKEAMKFRLKMQLLGRDISYSDAIGYQLSLKHKIRFLTGDKEFEGIDNVEFVK